MIKEHKIGCFNPFEMEAFYCPVCNSHSFLELTPYGGVWCEKCNAQFEVNGTCDGIRKLAVSCKTRDIWYPDNYPSMRPYYWTVIWKGDDEVVWLSLDKEMRSIERLKRTEVVG